jgi:competence protein CoiA
MSSLFGLNEFNHLVHVREVERGLACQCRCVVCEEPLVARQGSVREHHFAHASNREPCDSSHESLLHRYAKQVIVQARGLVAPMTPAVAHFLGISDTSSPDLLHALSSVQEEVMIGTIKPDLLVVTPGGIQVAVEIAYSSFCDLIKVAAFESLNLPALEIDLSRFTPDNFDPAEVKEAVIQSVAQKTWVWPTECPPSLFAATDPTAPTLPTARKYLPQEIISFSGRWVSIRQFPSGDIAVRVIAYDPDLVSLVKTVTKAHGARFNPQYKTWNVPRWGARLVRQKLQQHADRLEISVSDVRPKQI